MSETASTNKTFLHTLECWLSIEPEILVLFRYAYSAGRKSFEFFSSPAPLFERLSKLQRRTSVTAFRQAQLPVRGIVNDEFIELCMRAVPEGSEFLVVETVQRTAGRMSWFHDMAGETHAELREALEASKGIPVAVGLYPRFWLDDGPDVVTAYVPDEDGVIRPGAY